MATEQTALNAIGRALWDPRPTETDLGARQLAYALGYPEDWRVVRTIETVPIKKKTTKRIETKNDDDDEAKEIKKESDGLPTTVKQKENDSPKKEENNSPKKVEEADKKDEEADKKDEEADEKEGKDEKKDEDSEAEETKTTKEEESKTITEDESKEEKSKQEDEGTSKKEDEVVADTNNTPLKTEEAIDDKSKDDEEEMNGKSKDDEEINDKGKDEDDTSIEMVQCIVDRIYAGDPDSGCDMWFHHEAAMEASEKWIVDDEEEQHNCTPFDHKGGHLLRRKPLFDKGDKVQVLYQDDWFDASVLKRKETNTGFQYQVYYPMDNSKQSKVDENRIRPRPAEKDPALTATELGFGECGWKAYQTGNHKYKIVAPDGTTYKTKKAAMEAYKATLAPKVSAAATAAEEGDPPWRTTGNEYLGRSILWTHEHKASARRTVTIEQIGNIVGWISETDVDKAGEPGFVSEETGKPARLYHVEFKDDPRHPYASYLLDQVDLEEFEIVENLIPDEPAKKKQKKK